MNHPFESEPTRSDVNEAKKFEISLKSHAAVDETEIGENNSTHRNDAELHRAKQAIAFLHDIRRIKKSGFDSREQNSRGSSHLTELSNHGQPFGASLESSDTPTHIGRFEIIETLGRGGFAQVFKARDPKLNRFVALKVPLPNALTSTDSQMRFRREAEAAGMLSHPAIVPVFEAGSIGPVSFISYEYCPGENLAQWFEKQNRTEIRTAAQIVSQLADAVQHAHQRGVIHRDLKPSNVLISGSDESENIARFARITDFGLAKNEQDISLTREGDVLGTPAYMSPEQATGQTGIEASSDIYSLGVILYELITGQLPCRKENHVATLAAIVNEEPTDPRSIRSDVPKDVSAIALKCLNKRPPERYSSAHALAADLDAWLEGQTVSARHATTLERVLRWSRHNPVVAASLTFAFFSLLVGLSLTTWKWNESQLQADRAERHLQRLDSTIDQILGEVAVAVEDLPQLAELKRDIYQKVLHIQQELIQEESDDLQVQLNTLRAYRKIADIHQVLGQNKESLENVLRAKALIKKIPAAQLGDHDVDMDLVELLLLEAKVRLYDNQFAQSQHAIRDALQLLDSFDASKDATWTNLQYATAYRLRGSNESETNQRAIAKESMILSLQYARKLPDSDETAINALVDSTVRLAQILVGLEEQQQAAEIIEATSDDLNKFLEINKGNNHVRFRLANLLAVLARVQLKGNFIPLAAKTDRQALSEIRTLVDEFPDRQRYRMLLAGILQHLAACYDRYGANEMSQQCILESIQETEKLVDGIPKQESLMMRHQWHVNFLARRNLYNDDFVERCIETEQLANAILETHPDNTAALRSKTEVNLALATKYFREQQYDYCVAKALISQNLNRKHFELNPSYVYSKFFEARRVLPLLAQAHAQQGDYATAIQYSDQIYETCPYRHDIPYRAASTYAAILQVADRDGLGELTDDQHDHVFRSFVANFERLLDVGFTELAKLYEDEKWKRLIEGNLELEKLISRYANKNPHDGLRLSAEELVGRWHPLDYPGGRLPVDVAACQAQLKSQWLVVQQNPGAGVETLVDIGNAQPNSDYLHYKTARHLCRLIKFTKNMYHDADSRFETAMQTAREEALNHLEDAVDLGFAEPDKLRRNVWQPIRDEARFQACFEALVESEK